MEVTGVWAVVVAAGTGSRFGGPKQYADLGGRSVLAWSLAAARAHAAGVVAVVTPFSRADGAPGRPAGLEGVDALVAGGATRSASVRAGLAAVPGTADIIVVHDAARPFASPELWVRVIQAVRAGAEAAIPAVPVTDTLKRVLDGHVVETVSRDGLVAVQTPQAFRAAALRAAHAAEGDATDDAALIEQLGGRVVVVAGDGRNVKITRPEDLDLARRMLDAQQAPAG